VEDILKRIFDIAKDPYQSVRDWKKAHNKKVIGCYPMYLPEEIIHAAGALPVVIWRSNEAVTMGHSHVPPFNCGLTRSFVDDLVKGKLEFMDGMVFYRTCLQAQGLPFIVEQNAKPPYLEYLYLPALYPGNSVRDFLIDELERLKSSIEEYTGNRVTDDRLAQSIDIYNKNRRLMNTLFELRRNKPGILRAKEVMAISQAGMLMPKEEHNRLLEKLLRKLEVREWGIQGRTKVVIYGGLCQTVQFDLLDLIEELGMVVVDDDLYVGTRYYVNEVQLNDRPILGLADRYLKRIPPCATKGDWETDWTDYLIEKVRSTRANGIISLMIKFCPPHLCYYPDIKRKLAKEGIPEVLVEVEHEIVSLEQIKTRLQSNMEIMGGI